MGKLGVSIYPERSSFEQNANYLDLAHKYGFTRVFTSLLEITGDKEEVIANFKKIIAYANSLGMEVTVDIDPALFKQLEISYDSLAFFKDLGATVIRLDLGFTGAEEAMMTRNEYGLKIEINMSSGTNYVDNIMSYSPNTDNLLGSHNFYPMQYSGLSLEHFKKCTKKFKKYDLHTLAFVNSQKATYGPWDYQDGLVTLEMHRNLPIETQVKHLRLIGGIDDISIGNAYASENELVAMSQAFFSLELQIKAIESSNITEFERSCLFNIIHTYRGDQSDYLIRSSKTRNLYNQTDIPPHNTHDTQRGDISLGNNFFGQYRGELQITLRELENGGQANKIGYIAKEELFLLDEIKPWSSFSFVSI